MAVAGIEHGIGETQPFPPQAMDHAQRDLALGAELHLLRGCRPRDRGRIGAQSSGTYSSPSTKAGPPAPWRRRRRPGCCRSCPDGRSTGGRHRQTSPFLAKALLVDQQRAGVPKCTLASGDQLPAHVDTAIPGRLARHLLHLVPAAGRSRPSSRCCVAGDWNRVTPSAAYLRPSWVEALGKTRKRESGNQVHASAETTSAAMLFGYLICHRNHQLKITIKQTG